MIQPSTAPTPNASAPPFEMPEESPAPTQITETVDTVRFHALDEALKRASSDVTVRENGSVTFRTATGLQRMTVSTSDFQAMLAFTDAKMTPDIPEPIGAFIYGGARWRYILYRTIIGQVLEIRHIPARRFTTASLRVPNAFLKLLSAPRGIIFLTGPTGSGKSTTLAASIDYVNATAIPGKKIQTLEDPVEHLFNDDKCAIFQQEHGTTFESWSMVLQRLLRKDPDIVVFGELRSPETIAAAVSTAATGHLVIATLHTSDAAGTINRLTDSLKGQSDLLSKLADSLLCVLAQQIIRCVPGGNRPSRVAAYELLINTTAIANLIRRAEPQHIRNEISTGARDGMVTMNQSLAELVRQNLISRETATASSFDSKSLQLT